ncbi:VOC family protein [Kribbella sp. NPDC003557]|uniref:VOC family protein n=1 Tax=Kribbella sp. NPDC003557 TaxID=3154449 RepID=UPI0033B21F65
MSHKYALKGVVLDAPDPRELEPNYQPPTWPSEQSIQQMQLHLDIQLDDLESAHELALAAGARLMEFQPQPDVRVYADPVGHIFCFFTA